MKLWSTLNLQLVHTWYTKDSELKINDGKDSDGVGVASRKQISLQYSTRCMEVLCDTSKVLLPVVMCAFTEGASDAIVRCASDVFDDILALQSYQGSSGVPLADDSLAASEIYNNTLLKGIMAALVDPDSYRMTKWTLVRRVLPLCRANEDLKSPAYDVRVHLPLLCQQAAQAMRVHPPTAFARDVSESVQVILCWIRTHESIQANDSEQTQDLADVPAHAQQTVHTPGDTPGDTTQNTTQSTTIYNPSREVKSVQCVEEALRLLVCIMVTPMASGDSHSDGPGECTADGSYDLTFTTALLCESVHAALGSAGYLSLLRELCVQSQNSVKARGRACTLHAQAILLALQYGLKQSLYHSLDLFGTSASQDVVPQREHTSGSELLSCRRSEDEYSPMTIFFAKYRDTFNSVVRDCLCAHDVYLRILAFNLIADNPRGSEVLTSHEMGHVRLFLIHSLNVPHSKARVLICEAMAKVTKRLRTAYCAVLRAKSQALQKQKAKAKHSASKAVSVATEGRQRRSEPAKIYFSEHSDEDMQALLMWLMKYLAEALYPVVAGPFGHTSTVLGLLEGLMDSELVELDENKPKQKSKRKHANKAEKLARNKPETAANKDQQPRPEAEEDQPRVRAYYAVLDEEWCAHARERLMPCLQDPLEGHRQRAYNMLAKLHASSQPTVYYHHSLGLPHPPPESIRHTSEQHTLCVRVRAILAEGAVLLRSPRAIEGEAGAILTRLAVLYAERGFACGCEIEAITEALVATIYLGKYHTGTDNGTDKPGREETVFSGISSARVAEMDWERSCLWSRLSFVRQVLARLYSEVEIARQSLLLAAHSAPIYATVNALRYVLLDTSWKALAGLSAQPKLATHTAAHAHTHDSYTDNLTLGKHSEGEGADEDLLEEWRVVLRESVRIGLELVTLVAPVVRNESPEGNLPSEVLAAYDRVIRLSDRNSSVPLSAEKGAPDSTEGHEKEGESTHTPVTSPDPQQVQVQGPLHKMVLVCSWLTVQSVSQLVKCLTSTVAPVTGVGAENKGQTGAASANALISVDMIAELGKSFIDQLVSTVHVGAFEQARPGFEAICELCWSATDNGLRQLPHEWGERVFNAIASDSSNTRRSAGLPAVIMTLIIHDPSKTYFNVVLPKLVALATMRSEDTSPAEEATSSSTPTLPQVHALNILRSLCRDAVVGARLKDHFEQLLILAIQCFASDRWHVRNAATMLYAALLHRVLGPENRPTKIAKAGVDSFFALYPRAY
ncbi:hypothetical protein SARC_03690, partial [Sphaeroforma arctica JP610]